MKLILSHHLLPRIVLVLSVSCSWSQIPVRFATLSRRRKSPSLRDWVTYHSATVLGMRQEKFLEFYKSEKNNSHSCKTPKTFALFPLIQLLNHRLMIATRSTVLLERRCTLSEFLGPSSRLSDWVRRSVYTYLIVSISCWSFCKSFPSGGWKWINTGERGPVARRFRHKPPGRLSRPGGFFVFYEPLWSLSIIVTLYQNSISMNWTRRQNGFLVEHWQLCARLARTIWGDVGARWNLYGRINDIDMNIQRVMR